MPNSHGVDVDNIKVGDCVAGVDLYGPRPVLALFDNNVVTNTLAVMPLSEVKEHWQHMA